MDTQHTTTTEHELDNTTANPPAPARKRYARIAPLYKAMIWTSFALNLLLLIIVGVLVGILATQRNQVTTLVGSTQRFAGNNIAELQDVVAELQAARIIYTVPLDTRIPIVIDVPIQQTTVATLTEPIPLNVPANILFPAGGGNLNATVGIQLPAGLQLPIALDMSVPLETSIPVQLDVPVNIPLEETELGPQFQRLGAVVERLVTPAEPLLILPDVPPDSSMNASSTEEMPAVTEEAPATEPTVTAAPADT